MVLDLREKQIAVYEIIVPLVTRAKYYLLLGLRIVAAILSTKCHQRAHYLKFSEG